MTSPVAAAVADLPSPAGRIIGEVADQAIETFGDTLRSIVLFGSAAENRLRATSDVNVLIVLSKFDPARVERMTDVLRRAHAAVRLRVMWLTEAELIPASESFAVKFADIVRRHRVLFGADPVEHLRISRRAAIVRLRQVLLNLVLRLRASYALDREREERLIALLADAAGPLRASAAEILDLEGTPAPSPREALQQLASEWSPSASIPLLASITTARDTRTLDPGRAGAVFLETIDLARHLHDRASRLAESS